MYPFDPPVYLEPQGLPFYWQNETSGVMAAAVKAYLERGEVQPILTRYLAYTINAPCWRRNPHALPEDLAQLDALALAFLNATKKEQVAALLDVALDHGIDPL